MNPIRFKLLICLALLLNFYSLEAFSEKKVFAQLSSSNTQIPSENPLVFLDKVSSLSGLKFVNKNCLVIKEAGVYFISVTAQVGDKTFMRSGEVNLSILCNGCALPNSTMAKTISQWHTLDRITTHVILPLKTGDNISLGYSASSAGLGLIASQDSTGELLIPSVLLSIFKVE